MTNEARAESPNFTRLSYALQGAIDEANCQRKDDMLTVSDEKVNASSMKSTNPGKGTTKSGKPSTGSES